MPAKYGYPQPITADPPCLRAWCFVHDVDAYIYFCRSAAMPRISAFRVPIVSPSRSNVASRSRNERRPSPMLRRPGTQIGTSEPPPPGRCAICRQLACPPFFPLFGSIARPLDVATPHTLDGDADLTAANEGRKTDHRFRLARPRSRAGPDPRPSITPTRAPLRPPT